MTLEHSLIEEIKPKTKNLSALIESLASAWLSAQRVQEEKRTTIDELKISYDENKKKSSEAYEKWIADKESTQREARIKEEESMHKEIALRKELYKQAFEKGLAGEKAQEWVNKKLKKME